MWNGVKIKEGRRIFCDALFDILMLLADWEITSRSKLREVIFYWIAGGMPRALIRLWSQLPFI